MTAVAPCFDLALCEDDRRYAGLLADLLSAEPDLRVVDTFVAGEQACQRVPLLAPHLLLLGLELPGMDGVEVVGSLAPRCPDLEILILTSFADEDRVFAAMQAGASGYLVKGLAPARLVRAVRQVVAGGTVIEARLARRFWRYLAASRGRSTDDFGLTDHEKEVLSLVARGLTNPEAADVLGTTRRRVKSHLSSIYRKLGVNGRVQAAARAVRAGLVEV